MTAPRRGISRRVRTILTVVAVVGLAYGILSYQVPVSRLQYATAPQPSPDPQGVTNAGHEELVIPPEATLNIPKINVHVPVVYGSANDDTSFQKSLEHGVAHYGGSALPGEVGNVVTDTQVIESAQTGVMAPTTVPTLTLITCTLPGTSYMRLAVRAREANPAPRAAVAVSVPAAAPASVAPQNATKLIGSNSVTAKIRNVFVGAYDWFVPHT